MIIKHITFLDTANNYGQVLQCFALQRYLISLGHDAELIRFNPMKGDSLQGNASGLGGIAAVVRKLLQGRLEEKILARRNAILDKERDFAGFVSEHIKCTKMYEGIDALRTNPPKAEAYICGSDQIWGKNLLDEENAAWFLNFGDESVRRIAYAPSIGRDYSKEELPAFKRYLSRFQSISTREESAALQCRRLGFKAEVVADPTLLLKGKDYLDLVNNVVESKDEYLFAYILNIRNKEGIFWDEVSRYVSCSNLNVRAVYSSGYYQARKLIPNINPECATIQEWIAAIRDARCVITTSFHGAVFCILLHKPFIVFPLPERKRANDRLTTLLSSLGLCDRMYDPSASFAEQMGRHIAWEKVDGRLDSLRVKSRRYLERALVDKDD